MIAEANAVSKLNLYLKVTARRPDRYHDLETLFLPLTSPADRIVIDFDAAPGIRVSSSLAGLPENLENLAGRAALAYADASGVRPTWAIHIEKRIPVTAGMGGGSSDAGTVLSLLAAHYGRVAPDDLAALALTLGADVPFFLRPRAATATGVGDQITPIDGILTMPLLLVVNPLSGQREVGLFESRPLPDRNGSGTAAAPADCRAPRRRRRSRRVIAVQ